MFLVVSSKIKKRSVSKKSNNEIYSEKRFEVSAKPWGERRAVGSGSLANYSASVKKINRRKEISR